MSQESEQWRKECERLSKALEKMTQNRADERKGRTRAERELRETLQKQFPLGTVSFATPIGIVKSPFINRRGTPRQGCLVPSAISVLQFAPETQPSVSLNGITEFSHLWVLTVFHENTNMRKMKETGFSGVKPKITPPRLGLEVGVFSTRSPHRYNPIALTVVKVERVELDKGEIYVSGSDLVDGTPILDVKPYIPRYDAIVDARVPEWVLDTSAEMQVSIETCVVEFLENHLKNDLFFPSVESLVQSIREILRHDIRSQYQKQSPAPDTLYELCLGVFCFWYSVDGNLITVRNCEFQSFA